MSSIKLYNKIFDENIDPIQQGIVSIDQFLLGNRIDNRKGISLIIPISIDYNVYESLINEYKVLEPNQYYYPYSDLHITIFTFLSARDSYKVNTELEKLFINITEKVLNDTEIFNILLDGITFSKEAGFINGYDNDILITIRDALRSEMNKKRIEIDERYKSETAHVTFLRFVNQINNNNKFIKKLWENRNKEIGKIDISKIELVEHDWYNKLLRKRVLSTFILRKS